MKSLAQVALTGTSCAVFLLRTIASASAGTAAAATVVGTSSASFGGADNRVNSNRHLAVESLPQYMYVESKRDETADLSHAPADLHGFLQSDPAGGLTNLRGGQQQQQQQHEEDGKLDKDEPVVVLHDIFGRFDQVPELAARKGGGDGSSRSKGSKGSKGSGRGSSTGKGSKSKGSKGGSSSDSGKGKGGTKSSKGSTANTKKSFSKNKTSRKSDSSSTKKSGGNKRSIDDDKKSSSTSKQSDKSSSDSKKSTPSKKKSIEEKKKTNAQRMCSTPAEKTCRNNCIDNKCDASDDESSPCAKRCRYKCCSNLQSDDRSKKKGNKDDDTDEERSCNTMEEKSCRSKCFYKKKCRDDECKRECRRDCCVGGRIGSGSKTKNPKDKKKSDEESGSKEKSDGAGSGEDGDDGDEDDGKGCDTDVEKQCRDTCYIESSCQSGDKGCRKTCRQGCCDIDLSIVDILTNAQEQGGNADDDESLMSGDLPLSFRFTISTAERFTADDIMNGRDNSLKEDLEGGLKILVEDVVGESFRGDGWKEESRRARRRKLLVRYQSDSPPTVEEVEDVACPQSVGGGSGCKRVRAEATLELEDENENNVRQAFLSAISEAISDGRLESAIKQFNPDHGSRDPLSNNAESSNDGGGGRSLTNIQIAGIVVGALSFVVMSYLALKICQDRRRTKEERSVQGSSAPGSVSQQEAGYVNPHGIEEHDAYHDAYGGDHYEDQRLPPIPEPPQLPDRSSGKPRESKLAAVRRELQADPYEPRTPERALEAGGPSLVDLVATSYTPNVAEAAVTNENFDSTHQPSDEYYDGVQPSEGAAHAQQSENTLDQYADHEPAADDDYGPPPSPHRYNDGAKASVDLSAPIDFSQQQAAGANDYDQAQAYDDQAQGYGEDYHEYPDQEYVEDEYRQEEQYDVDDTYEQQGEEYYDDGQYHEQPMATDSWGEGKHASQYDYHGGGGGGYDEAPPGVAESDVSSKEGGEGGDGGGDAMTETSSQKFIETAKRMAAAEQDDPRSQLDNDAIEHISDRSDDEEAHSQARAYRHRAQAERIGRKSRVSDLINRFESS